MKNNPKVKRARNKNHLLFYTPLRNAVGYFTPLLAFILTLPAVMEQVTFEELFIFTFAFFLVASFCLTAVIRPRLRLSNSHILIYHLKRGQVTNIFLNNIKYLAIKKQRLIIVTKNELNITLPVISKKNKKILEEQLTKANIEILNLNRITDN
ncbi:MAG: hypothetical protein FWE37_05430 [Spirochaetaceae bacterium]|nr:hypothetical protein [Spirochaetaceae bacterium]